MHKKAVRQAGLMQFFYYFAMAAGANYFILYYKELLVDAEGMPLYDIIGLIMLFQSLVAFLSPMIAGYMADRYQITNRLITICSIGVSFGAVLIIMPGLAPFASLSITAKLLLVFPGAIVGNFFIKPIPPLIDAGSLKALEAKDGHVNYYGRIRMMGSLGWIISCLIVGHMLDYSQNLTHTFIFYAFFFLVLAFIAKGGFNTSVKKVDLHWSYLLEDKIFRVLIFLSFLRMMGFGMGFIYTGVYFSELNMNYTQMGLAFGLAAILEIPFFFWGDKLLNKLGGKKLIMGDLLLQAFRFGIFFFLPSVQSALFYVAVQTLMGLGVCLHLTGIMPLLNRIAPNSLKASYQNIYSASLAAASIFTGIIASLIVARIGSRALMGICGLIMILAFLYTLLRLNLSNLKKEDPLS